MQLWFYQFSMFSKNTIKHASLRNKQTKKTFRYYTSMKGKSPEWKTSWIMSWGNMSGRGYGRGVKCPTLIHRKGWWKNMWSQYNWERGRRELNSLEKLSHLVQIFFHVLEPKLKILFQNLQSRVLRKLLAPGRCHQFEWLMLIKRG